MDGFTAATAPDGQDIVVVSLNNARGTSATFMDWGATWLSCLVPMPNGRKRETLLRCATFSDHLKQTAYLGATVGRFANRIRRGKFVLAGKAIQLETNAEGNTLHGGPVGFSDRRWQVQDRSRQSVTFSLISADGDQGFPGTLKVTACYTLTDDDTVQVHYTACTDDTTPVSLTNHAYFNLRPDQGPILNHGLKIDADYFLPIDKHGIPLGSLSQVDGTAFDFCRPKSIGCDLGAPNEQLVWGGYDHAFALNSTELNNGEPAVSLWDSALESERQLRLDILTDMPALQLYTGNFLSHENRSLNTPFVHQSGVALETAFLPDAPNRQDPGQPPCFLQPGEKYLFETHYRFSTL